MRISNLVLTSNTSQNILDGIKQCIFGDIVFGLNPFPFENTPKGFSTKFRCGEYGGR